MKAWLKRCLATEAAWPLAWALGVALLAGLCFSLALAPYYYWGLALFSPTLLYLSLSKQSPKAAFWIGWAYGFGLWFVGAFWLYTSIHVYGDTSSALSVLMIAFMALVMGLFTAVSTWVYRRLFPETPLTFAPLWILFEWSKTWLFTGFPWLFVGYAFTERYLDHYAPLIGVFGVSFVAVLLAAACVEIFRGRKIWLIPSSVLLLGAWGAAQVQLVSPKNTAPLSVSLIQGNIPQDLKWLTEYQAATLQRYAILSSQEWGRDLIVWPESSIPLFQSDIPELLDLIDHHAKKSDTAWVSGIPYWDEAESRSQGQDKYYNSMMALGQESHGLYKKQRLVPFGEYIPLHGLLSWVLPNLKNDPSMSGFSQGSAQQQPLIVKGQKLAAAICYEVAYPNLTRRNAATSDFVVTVSNDAWFTGTAGPWQHLQMVQMRAKENGRWFIRATNTGVTAFINSDGQIVSYAPQDKRAILRGDLPAMQGRTLYSYLSDWPILILAGLLLLLGWCYRPKVVDTSFKNRR